MSNILQTQFYKSVQKSDVCLFDYGTIKPFLCDFNTEEMEEETMKKATNVKLSLRIKIRKEPYQVVRFCFIVFTYKLC